MNTVIQQESESSLQYYHKAAENMANNPMVIPVPSTQTKQTSYTNKPNRQLEEIYQVSQAKSPEPELAKP